MKSWTTQYGLANSFTNAQSTADKTLIKQLINDSVRTIATMRGGKWKWLDTTETMLTTTSATYELPDSLRKLSALSVSTAGSNPVIYTPTPIFDPDRWNLVLASRLGTSDVAAYYNVQNTQFTIAPTPATAGNTITLRGRLNIRDLSMDDYTTGTISAVTNGGNAVTGSGTTWTSGMAGCYIRITDGAAANLGDGLWYKISAVFSTTSLILQKPYEGATITAGSAAYTIGEMSPIPESYDVAPVYRATALYLQQKENIPLSKMYWMMYDGGKEAGLISANAAVGGLIGQMLDEQGETVEGAYISPDPYVSLNPNIPPRYPLTGM